MFLSPVMCPARLADKILVLALMETNEFLKGCWLEEAQGGHSYQLCLPLPSSGVSTACQPSLLLETLRPISKSHELLVVRAGRSWDLWMGTVPAPLACPTPSR